MRSSLATAAAGALALTLALGTSAAAAPNPAPSPDPALVDAIHQLTAGSPHRIPSTTPRVRALAEGPLPAERVAGVNRYDTAARAYLDAVAEMPEDEAPLVLVASGESFPDALAAGSAGYLGGFMTLLTRPDRLPPEVAAALRKEPPAGIVIAGGTSSVSAAVATQLQQITGAPVVRLAGANRYDTAALAAQLLQIHLDEEPVYSDEAWIVSGENFPDALAAGPATKFPHAPRTDQPKPEPLWGRTPLLLTARDRLPGATRAMLTDPDAKYTRITVVGGPTSVSDTVLAQIRAARPTATVVRVAGVDRYDTARKVATQTPLTRPVQGSLYASGERFPDALVAGSYVGLTTPLLLVKATCTPAPTREARAALGLDALPSVIFGGSLGAADPITSPRCP